jgi:hypothetical protein
MTGLEPVAVAALTKGVDFLFDQAGRILEERREARKMRGDQVDAPTSTTNHMSTTKEEVRAWQPKTVYLKDIPQEINHCLDMIHQHRTNKRYTEDSISQYGNFKTAPVYLRNELRIEEDEIEKWIRKLKQLIEEVYGHKIVVVGLD